MSSIIYDNAPLEERIHRSLSDTFKHRAIETAQDVITGKRDALVAEVDNWEDFRDHAAAIRDHVLANLDYYVREFAINAEKNGAHVYFAPTDTDALECILDIFEDLGATSCVKSKSMMTEEIGLNKFLEKHGISAIETDCAEHIIQTAGNAPSHIVVPALHFDRTSIRDLYQQRKGYTGSDDPEEITRFLRKILRPEFMSASVGVTGCNFGVAETGSCTLVSNEGNARMTSSIPETQIVVMGTERIVPDLRSLDVFMKLLVRSAVGAKSLVRFPSIRDLVAKAKQTGPKTYILLLSTMDVPIYLAVSLSLCCVAFAVVPA
jgi:L-lactate dehydrogenase complex protein LldF